MEMAATIIISLSENHSVPHRAQSPGMYCELDIKSLCSEHLIMSICSFHKSQDYRYTTDEDFKSVEFTKSCSSHKHMFTAVQA